MGGAAATLSLARVATRAALLLALAGGVALPAFGSDESRVLRAQAEQLAVDDRCSEAIDVARRASALDPDDARAAFVDGSCALRLGRYEEAIAPLERARALDPGLRDVSIQLVMAHFHSGNLPAADVELARAEAEAPDDPRVSLYKGLILLERAETEAAAANLQRAGELDAELDPLASYYAGLAWSEAEDRRRAEEALRRTVSEAPDSEWAREATLALERLERPYQKHWWAKVSGGLDYDSNAVLRGTGVTLPQEISNQADGRGWWNAETGFEFLRTPEWSIGATAGYSGDAYFELNQFNVQYPSLSMWVDRRVDEHSFVRLEPFGGYAWRDRDPYLGLIGGALSYHRGFGVAGRGRLSGAISYQDYHFAIQGLTARDLSGLANLPAPPNPAQIALLNDNLMTLRNRDGVEYTVDYEHRIDVFDRTGLRGGVGLRHYNSDVEYTHEAVRIWAGVRQGLPLELSFDLRAGFEYQKYKNASTFNPINEIVFGTAPDRQDFIWSVRTVLERPITDHIRASLRYQFVDDDSNTEVYNYDRHIVGGYVTILFGR